MLGGCATAALWTDIVDGVYIHYSDGRAICIYKGGEFYSLAEALGGGIIMHADVEKIATLQNGYETTSIPAEKIIQDYIAVYNVPTGERAEILINYGQYGAGLWAVMINCGLYTEALWQETVGVVTFFYSNGNRILIYDNGGFYTLPEAYEKGILPDYSLGDIANIQNAWKWAG